MKPPVKPPAKKRVPRAKPEPVVPAPAPEKPKRVRKPKVSPPWDGDKEAYLAKQAVLAKAKGSRLIETPPGAMDVPGVSKSAEVPRSRGKAKRAEAEPPTIEESEKEARGRGRPTAFKPEYIEQARKLALLGATDREVADFFDVAESTLYLWKHTQADFSEALKGGKQSADDRVVQSLYRKATGYSFDSEKVFQYEGEIIRAEIVEHVPPSDTAMIFWLKNRMPAEWRDKSDVDVNVKGDILKAIEEGNKRVADGEQA